MAREKNREPVESYTVRDLSSDTWEDFERFFGRYNGVQSGCWCMYYHRKHETPGRTMIEKAENNRTDHRNLVLSNSARGILIYHKEEPIGWCKYGTREELPRVENGRVYKTLERVPDTETLWRITCFFVDRDYRRRGVAKIALKEALGRIESEGGGIVEAYPVTNPRAYTIWFGTVTMFEEHGFEPITSLGRSTVLMRKRI